MTIIHTNTTPMSSTHRRKVKRGPITFKRWWVRWWGGSDSTLRSSASSETNTLIQPNTSSMPRTHGRRIKGDPITFYRWITCLTRVIIFTLTSREPRITKAVSITARFYRPSFIVTQTAPMPRANAWVQVTDSIASGIGFNLRYSP